MRWQKDSNNNNSNKKSFWIPAGRLVLSEMRLSVLSMSAMMLQPGVDVLNTFLSVALILYD